LIALISRWMAYLGGMVLIAIVIISNLSIFGRSAKGASSNIWLTEQFPEGARWLGYLGAVPSDIEFVEVGIALAIFMFFPWFVVNRSISLGNTLARILPDSARKYLLVAWNTLFALFMAAVTWQLVQRAQESWLSVDLSLVLGMPVWGVFVACALATLATTCIALALAVDYLKGPGVRQTYKKAGVPSQ